jgi:hypothetical protein
MIVPLDANLPPFRRGAKNCLDIPDSRLIAVNLYKLMFFEYLRFAV